MVKTPGNMDLLCFHCPHMCPHAHSLWLCHMSTIWTQLAVAAIGLGLCFIGSSPGVCYKSLPPILFHFSLVLLILVKIEMYIIELQAEKRKDLRRKVNVSFFSLLWSSGLFSKYYHCEISSVIFHKDKLYRCWPWIETRRL